jgi:hypothetical protein
MRSANKLSDCRAALSLKSIPGSCVTYKIKSSAADMHKITVLQIIAASYFVKPDRRANIPFPCTGNIKYKS